MDSLQSSILQQKALGIMRLSIFLSSQKQRKTARCAICNNKAGVEGCHIFQRSSVCQVYLHLTKHKNCFATWHSKNWNHKKWTLQNTVCYMNTYRRTHRIFVVLTICFFSVNLFLAGQSEERPTAPKYTKFIIIIIHYYYYCWECHLHCCQHNRFRFCSRFYCKI